MVNRSYIYQSPSISQILYDRYLIAQQADYLQFVIPIHEPSLQQNVLATEVLVHELSLLIAANHVLITFLDIQYTQQQSIQSILYSHGLLLLKFRRSRLTRPAVIGVTGHVFRKCAVTSIHSKLPPLQLS